LWCACSSIDPPHSAAGLPTSLRACSVHVCPLGLVAYTFVTVWAQCSVRLIHMFVSCVVHTKRATRHNACILCLLWQALAAMFLMYAYDMLFGQAVVPQGPREGLCELHVAHRVAPKGRFGCPTNAQAGVTAALAEVDVTVASCFMHG
jgi:hypothetical protein